MLAIVAGLIYLNGCSYVKKQELLMGTICDTALVTYNSTIRPIMTINCTNCHSGNSPSAGISLDDYAGVKDNVVNGKLWGTMNHDPGFKAMPQSVTKLDQCTLDKMHEWISMGALNN